MLAVQQRNEAAAGLLVRCGADPDLGDRFCSPLAHAAYQDSIRDRSTNSVELVLDAGAARAGYPPLFMAVNQEGSSAAVLGRLVAAGCDINGRLDMPTSLDHGETVLHMVASIGDAALVDAAVGLGADIHARSRRGRTPLHEAAWCERGHVRSTARPRR